MDSEVQKIIQERAATLPRPVKEAFIRIDIKKRLWAIAQKNGLRVDQSGILETETLLVLLDLEKTSDFIENLVRGGVPREIARRIATEVNTEIFEAIRSDLVAATETSQNTSTQSSSTIQPTPPTHVPRTLGADMTHAKMEGTFRIPPDSITVQAPATPLIPKPTPVAPVRNGQYASADPYREPIN